MNRIVTVTNAVKAQLLGLVNAVVALLALLGVIVDPLVLGGVLAVVNAAWLLFVAFTYQLSTKRIAGS
jgi:hypothetical protein